MEPPRKRPSGVPVGSVPHSDNPRAPYPTSIPLLAGLNTALLQLLHKKLFQRHPRQIHAE